MHTIVLLAEAFFIAAALSLDAFAVSFSYGASRIRLPLLSAIVIDLVCSSGIGLSLLLGYLLKGSIPVWITTAVCFFTLLLLGIYKLLTGILPPNRPSRHTDPNYVDADHSQSISPSEACLLAAALSLDGCAAGFGTAMGDICIPAVFFFSLLTEGVAVLSGFYLGKHTAKKLSCNLSWLCGLILILLAFGRLM